MQLPNAMMQRPGPMHGMTFARPPMSGMNNPMLGHSIRTPQMTPMQPSMNLPMTQPGQACGMLNPMRQVRPRKRCELTVVAITRGRQVPSSARCFPPSTTARMTAPVVRVDNCQRLSARTKAPVVRAVLPCFKYCADEEYLRSRGAATPLTPRERWYLSSAHTTDTHCPRGRQVPSSAGYTRMV